MSPRDIIDFIGLAAIWGASFLFMRVSVPEFGTFALMTVRCAVAALVMVGWLALSGQLGQLRGSALRTGLVGVIGSALPFVMFGYALKTMPAGLTSIFNATTPMWTAVVAWLWFRQGLPLRQLIGILVGFVGVVILAGARLGEGQTSGFAAALPVLACLVATLSYGVAANASRRYLQDVPPVISATGSQIGATIALAPLALANLPPAPPSATAWVSALILAVFCSALAYLLYFRLIRNVGPQRASAVTYLIPLFGVLWGAVFLGERLDLAQIAGGLVIIAGSAMVLGLRFGRRPSGPPSAPPVPPRRSPLPGEPRD